MGETRALGRGAGELIYPMKFLLLFLLLFTGCASAPNKLQQFLQTIPATNLAEVRRDFKSPIFSMGQSAQNITTREDGLLNVGKAEAHFDIPLWGTSDSASISGFTQIPSAAQVAAGAAIVNAQRR